MKRILFALALMVMAGCGDSGSGMVEPAAKRASYSDVVVIGNSITYHVDYPSIGWHGNRGMAATVQDSDFAHQTAAAFAAPVTAQNFAALERDPATTDAAIQEMAAPVKSTSLVVVELGDNNGDLSFFPAQYGKLLDAVKGAKNLVCVSTWWRDDAKDAVIKTACDAHGGHFAYIGDIKTDPLNQDSTGLQYTNASVNDHPHDWSMAQIAKRVVAAAQ